MSPEIIVAVIGLFGVLITTFFSIAKTRKNNLRGSQLEKELDLQRGALSFSGFLTNWGVVYTEIDKLLHTTEIDRFLILRAWNGTLTPKWTTAVYQMRRGSQEPVSYVHFELDSDYVDKLRSVMMNGSIYFNVNEIEDSYTKQIYNMENIKSSMWSLISEEQVDVSSKAITYCSFASVKGPISKATQMKCKLIANRLEEVASKS